jgi:hypothetical protein
MAIYWARLMCLSIAGGAIALLAGGAILLQPSDLKPFASPTTGQALPPAILFKFGTRLASAVDSFAFALKPPMAQLSAAASGYQLTHALASFARLRVAEAIEAASSKDTDGLADCVDIARHTKPSTDADALRRLLRYLAAQRLLVASDDPSTTRFGLTPATRLLLKGEPGSLWGMVQVQAGDHADGWANLDASLTNGAGTIAFDHKFGKSVWDHYQQNPPLEEAFASFMTAASRSSNAAIASAGFNFSEQCSGIVDVGGGHGSLLGELVAVHSSLASKATVVDVPGVVDSAARVPGVRFQPGDFFEANSLPSAPSLNCFILKHILHDWSDAKAVSILRNIRRAMSRHDGPGGGTERAATLLLAECVLAPSDPMLPFKAGLDVNMMAMVGGKERTQSEWVALLREGGFEVAAFRPTRSPLTLIVARMLR